jgi:hypothetical protein
MLPAPTAMFLDLNPGAKSHLPLRDFKGLALAHCILTARPVVWAYLCGFKVSRCDERWENDRAAVCFEVTVV